VSFCGDPRVWLTEATIAAHTSLRGMTTMLTCAGISVLCAARPPVRAQVPELSSLQTTAPPPAATAGATTAAVTTTAAVSPVELGDALVFHKRYQAAIVAYQSAPLMTASIWNKMGMAYQLLLNLTDATRCYKQSLKLDQKNATVYNNLATAYESQGDLSRAERMYRKAALLDPKFALAYKNLATCLMAQRKYKQGRQADAQALALDPTIFAPGNYPTVDNAASVHDRGAMNYYMAIDCARAGQTACALEHLRMALNQGYTSASKVAADSNFVSLAGDPEFQQLLAEQKNK
jgi:tetratricopeptide (TPR) repeat protein